MTGTAKTKVGGVDPSLLGLVFVYSITCAATGELYIGSTKRGRRRWIEHRTELRAGKHKNQVLQAAWDKHGESAFSFEVLENSPASKLITKEQLWIDKLQPALNVSLKAGVFHWSARHRRAASDRMKARWTPEARAALSGKMKGQRTALGYRHTEEFKAAKSLALCLDNPMKNPETARLNVARRTK